VLDDDLTSARAVEQMLLHLGHALAGIARSAAPASAIDHRD